MHHVVVHGEACRPEELRRINSAKGRGIRDRAKEQSGLPKSSQGCQRSFQSLVFEEGKSAGAPAGVVVDFWVLLARTHCEYLVSHHIMLITYAQLSQAATAALQA